jgi:hypothetical protein
MTPGTFLPCTCDACECNARNTVCDPCFPVAQARPPAPHAMAPARVTPPRACAPSATTATRATARRARQVRSGPLAGWGVGAVLVVFSCGMGWVWFVPSAGACHAAEDNRWGSVVSLPIKKVRPPHRTRRLDCSLLDSQDQTPALPTRVRADATTPTPPGTALPASFLPAAQVHVA